MRLLPAGIGFALLAVACAANSGGQLALHGEPTYAAPENVSCTPGATDRPKLTVRVLDEAGAAIRGVCVYLGTVNPPAEVVSIETNDLGDATVEAPRGDVYVLATAMAGFVPTAQAIRLKAGCTGYARVTLKIGPLVEDR
jgi:hypothetical protein